jgi:hypothetical protein
MLDVSQWAGFEEREGGEGLCEEYSSEESSHPKLLCYVQSPESRAAWWYVFINCSMIVLEGW